MREPPGSDRPGAEQRRQELAISSGIIGSSRSGTVADIRIGAVEAVVCGSGGSRAQAPDVVLPFVDGQVTRRKWQVANFYKPHILCLFWNLILSDFFSG